MILVARMIIMTRIYTTINFVIIKHVVDHNIHPVLLCVYIIMYENGREISCFCASIYCHGTVNVE